MAGSSFFLLRCVFETLFLPHSIDMCLRNKAHWLPDISLPSLVSFRSECEGALRLRSTREPHAQFELSLLLLRHTGRRLHDHRRLQSPRLRRDPCPGCRLRSPIRRKAARRRVRSRISPIHVHSPSAASRVLSTPSAPLSYPPSPTLKIFYPIHASTHRATLASAGVKDNDMILLSRPGGGLGGMGGMAGRDGGGASVPPSPGGPLGPQETEQVRQAVESIRSQPGLLAGIRMQNPEVRLFPFLFPFLILTELDIQSRTMAIMMMIKIVRGTVCVIEGVASGIRIPKK